ncbi:hypothetical protein JCM10450v2_001149 [Rhodotorula kratochvilovae]
MLRRVHCLLLIAALALLVAPAAAVNAGNLTTTPAFQLNLAERFSSTVARIKEKRAPSKTSKVGLAGMKKRTLSDELLDMIKGVSNAFAAVASSSASPNPHALAGSKPSASASWRSHAGISQRAYIPAAFPTSRASQRAGAAKPGASQVHKPGASQAAAAKPGASQLAGAKPGASQAAAAKPGASQAAGAAPAPGASQHAAAAQPSTLYDSRGKAARVWEYVRRAIQEEPWETLDSRLLCPVGETACPIYECLDTRVELESCGGCSSKGAGEDCTSIKGAQGVTCESGACHVYTCQPGWALDASFKRSGGGKGRCRKVLAQKERRAPLPAPVEKVVEVAKREEGAAAAVEAQ